MQRRAAGIASSRSAPISPSHCSHRAVGAGVELRERVLDVAQGLAQRAGQRLDLAPLGSHLARVGEVLVEAEVALGAVQRLQLLDDAVPLGLELDAQHRVRRLDHGVMLPLGLGSAPGGNRRRSAPAAAPGPGMRGFVRSAQPLGRHLRVHLRGRQAGVAEQLLDHPDVGAVVEHVGGARVAQDVRRQAVAETGADPGVADDPPARLA